MLKRVVDGPEISRVIEKFITADENEYCEECPHHEEGSASQLRFQRHVKDLMELLLRRVGKDLVTLDNKVCESAAAAVSVHQLESTGTYCCFMRRKHRRLQIS